jgi:osmoprotectant transport system permease protein
LSERPLIDWGWIADHTDDIVAQLAEHIWLTLLAVAIGFAISLPLAILAYRHRRLYAPITWVTGLLYTIPSLALFVLLIPVTGLSVLSAEIGLVSYTLLILIRNTVAGLNSVPEDVRESALGMGLTRRQLLWKVELPLAVPAIVAGLRIATVTTIGLVTVTALIGQGGLGRFILQGLRTFFSTATLLGSSLSVALALAAEGLFATLQRRLVPWSRQTAPGRDR